MAANSQKTMRQQEERHQQTLHSARSLKMNIVSARSQGNPKVNDVSINDDIVGVTVKPCNIYGTNNQLTTWKQIAETDQTKILMNRRCDEDLLLPSTEDEKRATRAENVGEFSNDNDEDASKEKEEDGARKLSSRSESMNWSSTTTTLNQTYSFREAGARVCDDRPTARSKRWRPVRHSPRVEFCLKEPVKVNQIYVSSLFSGETGNKCYGDPCEKPSSEERKGGEERLSASKAQESNRYFENSLDSSARSNNKIFEKKGSRSTGGYTDNEEEEEEEEVEQPRPLLSTALDLSKWTRSPGESRVNNSCADFLPDDYCMLYIYIKISISIVTRKIPRPGNLDGVLQVEQMKQSGSTIRAKNDSSA